MTAGAIELATPSALWALGLAAPVIALHLYHRRRRRVDVAFLPLLREASGATSPFGGFRRLADAASLLARLLALVALSVALAGPRPAVAATPPEDVVIVIDSDPTTRAKEPDGATRFEHAIRLAKAQVLANRGGTVSIVLAGDVPSVVVGPTGDRESAAKALEGLHPSERTSDLAAAVEVTPRGRPAGRPYGASPSERVIVLSSKAYEAPPGVEVLGIGTASDDQGFVDQYVGPSADGVHTTVRLTVKNFADEPKTRRIRVRLGEKDLDLKEVVLPARSTVDVTFEVLPPKGGALFVARLEGEDALATDDATGAWLTPVPRPSVLVVHGGAPRPFVTAFLDAMGDSIDREASGSVLAGDVAKAAPRDVVIVDGVALASLPTTGAYLFLAPFGGGAGPPFTPGREVKEPLVWRTEPSNPLLRDVDLSTAFVVRGTTILGDGVRGLAFVENQPIVAEGEKVGLRWIAFGLDPDGSDLAIRAALPVLLKNAVRRLGAAQAAPLKPFYRDANSIDFRSFPSGGSGLYTSRIWAGLRPQEFRVLRTGTGGDSEVLVAQSVVVDLDPDRDIRPARPEAIPLPPAPPVEDVAGRWRLTLLAAAAMLLLLDLLVARRATTKLAAAASLV